MFGRRSSVRLPSQWSATQLPNWPVEVDNGHPLSSSLVAQWLLNTNNSINRANSSQFGNTTSTNAPSIVSGLNGPATLLNGTNQTISAPGLMSAVPAFAVSIWINPTAANFANGGASSRFIANGHTDSDYSGFQLFWNGANIHFEVGNGTTSGVAVSNSNSFSANTWIHLVGVYTGLAVVLYVNGVAQGTSGGLTGSVSSNFNVAIGYNPAYSGDYTAGVVSNSAIWYRGLSPSEVAQLYAEPYVMLRPAVQRLTRFVAPISFTDTITSTDAVNPVTASSSVFSSDFSSDFGSVVPSNGSGNLSDTVVSSDSTNGLYVVIQSVSDAAITSDAFTGTPHALNSFNDFATTADTFLVGSSALGVNDTTTTSDQLTILGFAAGLTDTAVTSDKLAAYLLTDTAATTDSVQTIGHGFTFADAIGTSDVLTAVSTGSFANLFADTAATTDTFGTSALSATFLDIVVTSDQVGPSVNSFTSDFSSSFGAGYPVNAVGNFADTTTTSDNYFAGGFLVAFTDTAASTDNLAPAGYGGLISDSAITSDNIIRTDISLIFGDNVATATSFVSIGFGAFIADVTASNDAVVGTSTSTNLVVDSTITSDTLTTATYGLGVNDTVGTSDVITTVATFSSSFADVVSSYDVLASISVSTPLFDTVLASDALITLAFGQSIADTAITGDILAAGTYGLVLSDAVSTIDILALSATSTSLSDAAATSDAITAYAFTTYLSDTAVTFSAITAPAFGTLVSDSATVSDALTGSAFSAILADSATTSDISTGTLSSIATLQDAPATASDTWTVFASLTTSLSDTTITVDASIGSISATITLVDTTATSDTTTGAVPPGLAISDTTSTSDGIIGSITGHASPSDTVTTLDSFFASAISVAPLYLAVSETQTIAALRRFLQMVLPTGIDIFRTEINRVAEPLAADFVAMTPIGRVRLSTNYTTYADYYPTPYGSRQTIQPTQVTVQLDVHGPNSADNSQIITTLFRDGYACQAFQTINPAIQPLYAEDPRQMVFDNGENQMEQRWVIDVIMQVNQTVITTQDFAGDLSIGVIDIDTVYPSLN